MAVAGVGVAAVARAPYGGAGWGGGGVGLVLQTPLGWWAIQSIGTERFMAVWTLGMLVRLAVVPDPNNLFLIVQQGP